MDKILNCPYGRYIAKTPKDVEASIQFTPRSNFPAKAKSFGLKSCDDWMFPLIWINEALDGAKLLLMLTEKVSPALHLHCRGEQLGVSGGWDFLLHLPRDP